MSLEIGTTAWTEYGRSKRVKERFRDEVWAAVKNLCHEAYGEVPPWDVAQPFVISLEHALMGGHRMHDGWPEEPPWKR